jgi:hypothetical protein
MGHGMPQSSAGTFVDGGAVAVTDLPKLVNAAHSTVGKHKGARLQHPLPVVLHLRLPWAGAHTLPSTRIP